MNTPGTSKAGDTAEYQCIIKQETKKAQKDKINLNSMAWCESVLDRPVRNPNEIQHPKGICRTQEDLISRLVMLQEAYASLSEDDFNRITAFPVGDSKEDSLKRFQHIIEITILTVQLIVKFSRRIPWFDLLSREDQITLLKACSSEVLILRTAWKYDIKTDSIESGYSQRYTLENYRSICMGDSADSIFQFCRNMCTLKVDNAEYALLTALAIFSERPSLSEPKKVEKFRGYYLEALKAYVSANRPPRKNYFVRLLAILDEIHTLSNMNSEIGFSLRVQNKEHPAFLEENRNNP